MRSARPRAVQRLEAEPFGAGAVVLDVVDDAAARAGVVVLWCEHEGGEDVVARLEGGGGFYHQGCHGSLRLRRF